MLAIPDVCWTFISVVFNKELKNNPEKQAVFQYGQQVFSG